MDRAELYKSRYHLEQRCDVCIIPQEARHSQLTMYMDLVDVMCVSKIWKMYYETLKQVIADGDAGEMYRYMGIRE